MRWHAAAAAALLLALIAAGSPAAKPPPGKTPPGQGSASRGKPKPPKSGSQAWIDAADAVCARGSAERKAALASIRDHPSRTARATLLRILSATVGAEARMLDGLRAVKPPRSVRVTYSRALSLFRSRQAADARTVARLRKRWSAPLLERRLARDRVTNNRLANLWQALGATTCAEYFAGLTG